MNEKKHRLTELKDSPSAERRKRDKQRPSERERISETAMKRDRETVRCA
jgi:hypothetical protein